MASDATPSLLRGRTASWALTNPRVVANVYHLPFANDIFDAATMVRVFGFLTDPGTALQEVHRVLRPGGVLILSFEPHPSVGSLVDDLKVGLAHLGESSVAPRTFSRENVVPVRPSASPTWSYTRHHLRTLAANAGFSTEAEYPCGLEDLAGIRSLPVSVVLSLARALSRLGGFPTRFVLLRKGTVPELAAQGGSGGALSRRGRRPSGQCPS